MKNILLRIKELINQGWCQGMAASDITDVKIGYQDPAATNFCLFGATCKAAQEEAGLSYEERNKIIYILDNIVPESFLPNIVAYNDLESTTKEDVIKLLDKAIEDCGS